METKDLCDRNVKVMYSFYFLFSMARGLMQGPFLDQFIFTLASETSENLGNLIVGSFESVAGITKLLVAIPIGCWLDARPTHRAAVARRAVPWGLLAVTFGVTSLWTDRLELVGLMLFIFTCFSELATCVAGAIFADSLMSKSLSERTSAYTKCQVFETLGIGVGSGLNGVAMLIFKSQDLDEWSGFQTKATLLAGFALLFPTMLALVAFKNPPQVVKDTSDESSEGSEEARCWVPYLLSMSLLLSSLGSGLIVKFLPLFFIQLHGMSPAEISLLQCGTPFVVAAATKLLGSCAQAVGRGKISVFCLVGVILSLIFMSKVSTLWLLLALFIIRGSLANARFPLTWSILMDYTPSTRRGLWNSVLSVLSMSWSASAVLGGAIVDQHSYQYSFQVAAGLFAAALALFLPLLTLPLDASTSESGSEPETSTTEPETEMSAGCCVVVVDPFSTGGVLAAELLQRGVQVIALWTKESNVRHHDYPSALEPQQLLAEIDEAATLQETAAAVQQVASFAAAERFPLVVKPVESAGADGFKLCHSMEEARAHFEHLNTTQRWCGAQGSGVLVQEFLDGTEFVVDQVSRDGVHKTTMIWMYDVQEVNGSYVCTGQRPVASNTPTAESLVTYTRNCLDALGIRNGASHSEVILTADGPCLVEVNCRCQGGDGFWMPLTQRMAGYSQVDVCTWAYLDPSAFAEVPDVPPSACHVAAEVVHLISHQNGRVKAMPGLEVLRNFSSFMDVVMNVQLDECIKKSTDWYTLAGVASLSHPDPTVLADEIWALRDLERAQEFFTLQEF